MSKAHFADDIVSRIAELDSLDEMFCSGLLTISAYASAARSQMVAAHLTQSVVPIKPEMPGVVTGHEYLFGEHSLGKKINEGNVRVVRKIEKHPGYVYTLLVYNQDTGEYGIRQREEVQSLGECFGYKWNNTNIDSYKVGSIIPDETILSRSPTIDEEGNYNYGVNANVVYIISQETIEDAVAVSEKFAKKLSTMYVDTCTCPINDNDIPLNLYGTGKEYKSFPEVGEKTLKGIIFATRRKNKVMDIYNLKNSNLRKIFTSDDIYQVPDNYYIADIDIWSNKTLDEIPDLPAYSQLKRYMERLIDYYTEIYEVFGKIINTPGTKYTAEFSRLYAKARDYLDPACKYADDDRIFSNVELEFKMYKVERLRVGCKIAGRYGNKSVISKILTEEEMGHTEDGLVPDIRIDALGVLGRLNTGQCIEQELNWMAETVRKRIENTEDNDERKKLLFGFLDIASPNEAKELKKYLKDLSSSELDEFMKDIIENGITIIQPPMNSVTGDDLCKLYREIKPSLSKLYFKDDDGNDCKSMREVLVGKEYIVRLKHEPLTKFSARSKSVTNPRTSLPIKSTQAANKKKLYPDQCNKVGEQETAILMLSTDYAAFNYFLRLHSTSAEGRRMSTLFEDDYSDGFVMNIPSEKSTSVDMLNAYLKTIGYKINIKYAKGYDAEEPAIAECDIPDAPKWLDKALDECVESIKNDS